MAEMRPPPPRYRIIEHKGRLIATDTWDKNRPTRNDTPLPRSDTAPPRSDTSSPGIGTTSPRLSDSPRLDLPRARPEPASNALDTLGAVLVLAVCRGSLDPAGRPILNTLKAFDLKGPRRIVLSPEGAERLGRRLTVTLAMAMTIFFLLWAFPEGLFLFVILFGLAVHGVSTKSRPAITRWLDDVGQN